LYRKTPKIITAWEKSRALVLLCVALFIEKEKELY
jgi:hypothetical protein